MNIRLNPIDILPTDLSSLRTDFPILDQQVHGQPLVYLDNAATTQKPLPVIETLDRYYREYNANIHRGVHSLSEQATEAYEQARVKIKEFINAADHREILFTAGTTASINLVAQSYGRSALREGDEILITEMEHHSNIVPWQLLCAQTGTRLVVVPINERGETRMDEFRRLLGPRTRLLSVGHVSNALGSINPVEEMISAAHERDVPVLIDGAQAVAHMDVDVQALDCDFYAFSGHKLFGPTGIGVLYGKAALLEAMPPWQGGGDMIKVVSFSGTEYNHIPYKFEAGTPHIAGGIGLGAAIDYVSAIGRDRIRDYEHGLLEYATARLLEIPGLRIIGTAANKTSVLSFNIDGVHATDLGMILDHEGIAIRIGHHCAMPVMQHFDIPGTARASFSFYNTRAEIDHLTEALVRARDMLAT